MLFVPPSMSVVDAQQEDPPYFGAIIEFNKIYYTWTDVITIVVTAPNFNSDADRIEYIGDKPDNRITITSTNGKQLDFYKLEETDVDTGVFFGFVLLTGFPHDVDGDGKDDPIKGYSSESYGDENFTGSTFGKGSYDGRMKAEPGDTITVKFSNTYCSEYGGNVCPGETHTHEAEVYVWWWLADLVFQPSVIKADEPVTVTVNEEDMNLGVFLIDSFFVNVFSDSDLGGFQLKVTERELFSEDGTSSAVQDSPFYDGKIIVTDCAPLDQAKNICTANPSANILAKPGDTITVEYTDHTLPYPDWRIGDFLTIAATAKMSGSSIPDVITKTPEPTTTPAQTQIISDSSFKKYTDDYNRFSIEYPDVWVLAGGHTSSIISFDDQYNWRTDFQIFWNEDDALDNRSDSKVLRAMESNLWETCGDETFAVGDRKCTDFKAVTVDSNVFYTNDNKKVYFVKATYTMEFSDYLRGQEHSIVKTFGLIYDGKSSWALITESYEQVADAHYDEIIHMMKSFSLDTNAQQQTQPTAKSVTAIPAWIKNNAGWWAEGQIDDSSFLQGIQFLIKEGIMVIPPTVVSGSSDSQEVPGWIKNNAEWWSDGQIDDNTFVSGIQYLVKVGIIKVG